MISNLHSSHTSINSMSPSPQTTEQQHKTSTMDFSESTRIVYTRIQQLEPQLASKIIGYLLLQDNGDHEMIRLAFGPDNIIRSVTDKIKTELSLLSSSSSSPNKLPVTSSPPPPIEIPMFSPQLAALISPRITSLHTQPHLDNIPISRLLKSSSTHIISPNNCQQQQQQQLHLDGGSYLDSIPQQDQHHHHHHHNHYCSLHSPSSFSNADHDHQTSRNSPLSRTNLHRRSGSDNNHHQFPVKVCHYFVKGFCKHGGSCKYFHGNVSSNESSNNNNNNSLLISSNNSSEDNLQMVSPGSLEKLEWELMDLLRSRNGGPVSIAMLPMLYYERYGRNLQAQGYLTESQRHGKAGFSLTKLLARMNRIRLIDRAHGQHVVILAEDLPKYLETNNNDNHHHHTDHGSSRDHHGPSNIERQIYLTFPAESTFSEEDVSNYFSAYGPVEDVRIPNQQQRMYGFVSFVHAETVRKILAIGNPHFICNSRVLAKPYKEKAKLHERKNTQRKHHQGCRYIDGESELHHGPRLFQSPRAMRKHFMEQFEPQLELERRRIEHLMSTSLPIRGGPSIAYSLSGLNNRTANQGDLPAEYGFNYMFDVLNTESAANEERGSSSGNDQESDDSINLPDSPFAAFSSI